MPPSEQAEVSAMPSRRASASTETTANSPTALDLAPPEEESEALLPALRAVTRAMPSKEASASSAPPADTPTPMARLHLPLPELILEPRSATPSRRATASTPLPASSPTRLRLKLLKSLKIIGFDELKFGCLYYY